MRRASAMFEMRDPVCPQCGSKLQDFVSEFLFSPEKLPTLRNTCARVRGYKCGCGHKFVVVAYDSNAWQSASLGSAEAPQEP